MISWAELFNLLEGQTLHLAAPKTHFSQDIVLSSDIPVFATSIEMIKFVDRSSYVSGENAMIEARWREINFFFFRYLSVNKLALTDAKMFCRIGIFR